MLHIICPFRGREDRREDFVQHFRKFYPTAKIVLVEQADHLLFRKGQLNNLAFTFLEKELENFIFIDIDMRLFYHIDFETLALKADCMLIPYNEIYRYQLEKKLYRKMDCPVWTRTPGGMHLFNKKTYIKSCGYSNLYIGHAAEDLDMTKRVMCVKLKNRVIHLEHPSEPNSEVINRNLSICNDRAKFDKNLDGFIHTTAKNIDVSEHEKNVFWLKISGIGVVNNFRYKGFLRYD